MVGPCPCKSRQCACAFEGDGGITVSGNGSERLPYVPRWALWSLVGEDTSQADVTITGSGTSGSPWVISVVTDGGSIEQTIFTNDGTWARPSGTIAQVVVIGGGGGGGAVSDTSRPAGGSGGSGGAMSVGVFPLSDLLEEEEVSVGQGGARGLPFSGETTGGDGGDSWFGRHLFAGGGRGGKSQALAAQTQYVTVGGTAPDGGPGGAGSVRTASGSLPATEHTAYHSPTGGGMGNGNTIARTLGGLILPARSWGGRGGDGGEAAQFTNVDGAAGGLYGGGGGGGAVAEGASWASRSYGGAGAPGVVVVTVW